MKPTIGINADYRGATEESPGFSFLASGYYDAVAAAGGIPIILPPIAAPELLDLLDGVVFSGGRDLDCRRDGWRLHPSMRIMAERREVFDRWLMQSCRERRMPVLGIGVGMQLLNVVCGGTLYLHLPEDRPDAMPHLDPCDRGHRHRIEIERGSLLDRVYHTDYRRVDPALADVTSCHHQAVDDVAPGFRVTAACPDGIVEAIESETEWFAFGVQFHPEAVAATEMDSGVFEEFVKNIAALAAA